MGNTDQAVVIQSLEWVYRQIDDAIDSGGATSSTSPSETHLQSSSSCPIHHISHKHKHISMNILTNPTY